MSEGTVDPGGQIDMQQLLAAAQQMQDQLMNAQQELADAVVEGSAGGGLVKAKVNGQGDLVDLTISPAVIEDGDADDTAQTIADLVLAAVRDANRAAADLQAEKMGPLASGIGALGGRPRRPRRPGYPARPAHQARTASRRSLVWATSSSRPRGGEPRGDDLWRRLAPVYEGIVQSLIDELGRLPGVGRRARSASRSTCSRRTAPMCAAGLGAGRGDGKGPVLRGLRQRGRGRGVPDLP